MAFAPNNTVLPCAVLVLQAVQSTGNKVLSWEEAMKLGAAKTAPADPPKADDLSTIMCKSLLFLCAQVGLQSALCLCLLSFLQTQRLCAECGLSGGGSHRMHLALCSLC
jgi:hypothetical protein